MFRFFLEAAPVLAVTLSWHYRMRQKVELGEHRKFLQLLALLLCSYSAIGLAVLSEMNQAREPDVVTLSTRLYLAHLLVSLAGFVLALFGRGRVRIAALIAAAFSAGLWYMYSIRFLP
jgi:hypothetical protein